MSSSFVDKSYSRRLALNSAISKSPYHVLPVDDVGHSNFEPVGRGGQSSPSCGKHVGLDVCKNLEGHEGRTLNGEDCTGMVVNRNRHLWCHKSSCCVCFIRGWSVRGARSITDRLETGVKRGLGKIIDHVVVSVAVADRNLPESVFRKKSRDALFDRGVSGGCMPFHGFRVDKERRVLVWKPHYHALCFIDGGFDRCRECVHKREDCASCDGFKGKEVRGYAKDKYLVKVLPERKTIFGTAWYILNHSTVRIGIKRFHVTTYFGSCGNRKFASEKSVAKCVCSVCGDEYERDVYVGDEPFVKDVGHPKYKAVFLRPLYDESGKSNYLGSPDKFVRDGG